MLSGFFMRKEVHNPVHTDAEPSGTESHEKLDDISVSADNCEDNLRFAGACETPQNREQWAVQDLNL